MATSVMFGRKLIKLPGTYGTVISGIKNETPISTYGNVLLIDAGLGVGYNSIMGIEGNGKKAIYSLDKDLANFYVKGGPLGVVLDSLFTPKEGVSGASRVYLVKAATSVAASVSTWSIFGGAITATKIETVEQGTACNASLTSSVLKKGYQIKAKYDAGSLKGYVEIWAGTYQGVNEAGYLVGDTEANSQPICIYRSKKCLTPLELVTDLNNSSDLKALVTITGLAKVADTFTTTTEVSSDFAGGTDTYASSLASVLEYIQDVDYSFIMSLKEDNDQSYTSDLLDYILNTAKGVKQLVIYSADYDDAITLAKSIDNDAVICCSGVVKQTSKTSPDGYITHDPCVTAALVLGRLAGLSPEIPGTFKSLAVDAMEDEPSDSKLEELLDAGVITPYYDGDLGYFCMSQAVNTLQKNTYFVNDDCSTYSIQVKRILAAVVKNLQLSAKLDFFSGTLVANKGSLSPAYLTSWLRGKLENMVVNQNKVDANYLLTYAVNKIEYKDDSVYCYYSFTINGEINKVFFVATLLG